MIMFILLLGKLRFRWGNDILVSQGQIQRFGEIGREVGFVSYLFNFWDGRIRGCFVVFQWRVQILRFGGDRGLFRFLLKVRGQVGILGGRFFCFCSRQRQGFQVCSWEGYGRLERQDGCVFSGEVSEGLELGLGGRWGWWELIMG